MSGAEHENGPEVDEELAGDEVADAERASLQAASTPDDDSDDEDSDDDGDDDSDDGDDSDDDDDDDDDEESDDEDESDDDESDDEDESDEDESDEDDESDDEVESEDESGDVDDAGEDELADEDAGQEASAGSEDEPELSVDTVEALEDEAGDGARVASDGEGEGDDTPDETADAPPLRTILEAVLFAAAEPVPLNRLVKLLGAWPRPAVKEALDELGQALLEEGRGLRLAETAGGLQLRSASECAPWVRRFFSEKPPRLSRAVLETLAIVAYRQPATRGEVEAVRGVNCDAVLGALLTRNLIHVVGRRQSPGRPVEYGTTESFLELFSLKDLSELPDLPEPEALARLIEEAEAQQELTEDGEEGQGGEEGEQGDAHPDGENPEDLEPGGDRVAEGGGGPDQGGEGPAEREGDLGARDEGGPEQG